MSDIIISDRLELILEAINLIEERIITIDTSNTTDKLTILDSLAMRLQQIGENIKKINQQNELFFEEQLLVDVDPIIRFRDFIAHHYEKTDFEIVLDICKDHIPKLKIKIVSYLNEKKK